jgi:microcompartment protein CcmL/EutN
MMESISAIEFESVATGLLAVDALTKRARVEVRAAGVVEPGKFVILFGGDLAEVEEGFAEVSEGRESILIASAHPGLQKGLGGGVGRGGECVGVIETRTIPSMLGACDRALKDAAVELVGLRIQPGLGGRAYFAVSGSEPDVEAAIAAASGSAGDRIHRTEIVRRPTSAFLAALLLPGALAWSDKPLGGA